MGADWEQLTEWQCGVVTLDQCRRAGISSTVVADHVAAGRWLRLHRRVRLTSRGPATYEQRVWAGVLAHGPGAVASHETALWLADRRRAEPRLVHVAVLEGRRSRHGEGCRVHYLPDLGPERVLPGAPPRVRPEHAVVDLERLCRSQRQLVSLVTGVVGGRVTTAQRLRRVVDTRPRLRWRREMGLLLADVEVGAQSVLEVEDLRNDRRHGLPVGNRQAPRRRAGHREWLDVLYAGAPGMTIAVVKELDGRMGHEEPEGKQRDRGRDTAGAVRGQFHLRLGWENVVGEPCAAAARTGFVLRQAGWTGQLQACSRSCSAAVTWAELAEEVAAESRRSA